MNDDRELTAFKNQINLVDYAVDCGYELDRQASSPRSFTLRRKSDNDKIIVGVKPDGKWGYWSARDDNDRGTILDFVKRRQTGNLGEIRKLLRPWIGRPSTQLPTAKPDPVIKDRKAVKSAWGAMVPIARTNGAYLRERGLIQDVWASPRFAPMIRQERNRHQNIAFPHYDRQGLCGFEVKNRGFTGFAPGGTRAIWCSTNMKTATTAFIAESAIDCLSHAQLMRTGADMAYISIAGQLADDQLDFLCWLLNRRDNIAAVEIGTDNDDAGHDMAERLMGGLPDRVKTSRAIPATGKDWNDTLRA